MKNVLVLVVLLVVLGGGVCYDYVEVFSKVLMVFVVFSLVVLVVYFVNDVCDVEVDWEYFIKRFWLIVVGVVFEWLVYIVVVVLGVILLVGVWMLILNLVLVMVVYFVM